MHSFCRTTNAYFSSLALGPSLRYVFRSIANEYHYIFILFFSGKFLFAKSRCRRGVGIIRGAENNARPSISLQIQYLTFYNRGIYIYIYISRYIWENNVRGEGSWSEQCHYVALENLRVFFKKEKYVAKLQIETKFLYLFISLKLKEFNYVMIIFIFFYLFLGLKKKEYNTVVWYWRVCFA